MWLRPGIILVCCFLLSWAREEDNKWLVDETIPSLLRFNLKGQVVSSDVSEYIKFKCTGEGSSRSCEIDDSNTDIMDLDELLNPSSDDSLHSYLSGVALYFAIALVAAILIIVLTIVYLLSRIAFFASCFWCCGSDKDKKSYFPAKTRFPAALGMMTVFFAFMAVALIMSYVLGVQEVLSGISDVPDAPYGVANIVYRFSLAMQPTYIGMVSTVMLPTLKNVNTTFCSVVNWEEIINDLKDIEHTVDNLPDFNEISDSLTTIQEGSDSINDDIQAIYGDNDAYEAQKIVTVAAADTLIADLMGLQDALDALSPTVTAGQSATAVLSADYVTFFGADGPGSYTSSDQDGDVDSAQYDIERTVRSDTAGEGIPTSATLTDAATGVSDSLTTLIATTLDEDVAGITALADKLRSIYLSIVQLPDFDATADTLEGINTQLAAMLSADAVLEDLDSFLTAVQSNLDDIPDTDAIATNAETFFVEGRQLSTQTTQAYVESMDATLQTLPDEVDLIIVELEKISDSILSIIPPLYDLMVIQPQNFNRTIMEMPYDTVDLFNTINETVYKAAEAADEVIPQLRDLKDTLTDTLDASSYMDTLVSFDNDIDENLDDLDEPGMLAAIAAGSIDTTFDPATSQTQLDTLRTAVTNAEVPSAVITAFRNLQDICSSLESQLKRVAVKVDDVGSDGVAATADGDYYLLAQGVCSDDTTVYCAADSDCSSGTCANQGDYRCTPSTTGTDPVTSCTADADCTGITDSYCLADSTRASDLQTSLVDLANVANTEFNQDSVATNFGTLRTSAAAFDVDQMDSDLDAIQTDIAAADTDIYVTGLQNFESTLDDNDDQFADILDDLSEGSESINSVDYSSVTDQIDEIQEQIDSGGDKLGEYITFAQDLQGFLYNNEGGLNSRFKELSENSMQSSMDSNGFGPTLMATTQTFESTVEDFRIILENNTFDFKRVELTNSMREPAMYLDRATGNPNTGFFDLYTVGSLYYFMQLSNATADMMVHARDPIAYAIVTDKDGNAYPDNKICVTRACFENQQTELEDGYGMYFPLVLIPLAIVALIALINALCAVEPCLGKSCRNFCPKMLLCWIIVITPLYLIGTGFFFTFLITLSDGCTSGPKIAANYIQAYGDDLCTQLQGNGTLNACHITGNDFNVTVNLNRMSDVILGLDTCSGNNEDDPFFLPLNAFAGQIRENSGTTTRKRVYHRRYRKYRPTVKNIVLDFVDGSAQVTHDFVQDMGDDVLTCENMQAILDYFTTPVCYSVVGPATWLVVTMYLCAWAMCCLGIPAACALKNHYKWSEIEEGRRLKDAKDSKNAASAHQLLRTYLLATRRGRGMMATRKKHHVEAEDDLEKIELHIAEDEASALGLGAGAASYHQVSVEPGPAAEAFRPPPAGPGQGYFAYYPKTSAKETAADTKAQSARERVMEQAKRDDESDGERGERVQLGGKEAASGVVPAHSSDEEDV